jgi:chromosome partitioning protein
MGTTNVSSHPVSEFTGQLSRFLFGTARYTRREPAIIIAVLNLKGGCGKSTIAVNLACELAGDGDAVLLLDNDAQGTASHWLSHGRLPIQGESMPLENDADGERLVRAVAARNERYVVLDAPAHVEAAAQAAGKIADLVLVPVTASGVDLVATELVVKLIREVRVLRRSGTPKCLIVPSKIDRRTDAGRRIDEQVRRFGENVGPAVHQRTAFVDAFSAGQWIGQYAPDSPAHYDITALAMAAKRSLRI